MWNEPSPETLLLRVARGARLGLHGENVVNSGGWHVSGLTGGGRGVVGWKPEVHYGAAQVQATAPHEATGSNLTALKSAAGVSAVAFASAVRAEWGDDFADAVAPCMAALRADVLAYVP